MPTHAIKVTEENDQIRLDVFLTSQLEDAPSRSFVKKLIDNGHVTVNEVIVKAHHLVAKGDDVFVIIPKAFMTPQYVEPQNIPINIFYQDSHFIVVNKKAGMLVHPAKGRYTDTLVNALKYLSIQLSDFNDDQLRPGIVHRLDQETSGLIVVAKDNISHTKLAKQFQKRIVKKKYVALVEGDIEFDEGVINAPIGTHHKYRDKKTVRFDDSSKESTTYYKVRQRNKGSNLVELYPKTGRTHQLRVHMKYLGHPILGDDKYGKKSSFHRLALHATAIGFKHPANKKWIEFVSLVPHDFLSQK